MNKLHELTGKIISKERRKVYNKDSEFWGNNTYKLGVIIDNQGPDFLFAYPNLVSKQTFQAIENSRYIDRRYLFSCARKNKRWVLHKWEELNRHV